MQLFFKMIAALFGLVIILTGAAIFYLNELNFFSSYEELSQTGCQPVLGLAGVEDIAPDTGRGIAFLSSMDRQAKAAGGEEPVRGKILAFNPEDPLDSASWKDRTGGMPAAFEPLGISYYEDGGLRRLFVINEADASVLLYDINDKGDLTLLKTLTDYRLTSPNSIVATGPVSFYVANDAAAGRNSLKGRFDFLTRSGTGLILYYDGLSWSNAAEGLRFPAGLAVSEDGTALFASELSAKAIALFDRDPETGILTRHGSYPLGAFPDNLYYRDGLWIGAHLKPLSLMRAAKKEDVTAPSTIFRLKGNRHTGFREDQPFADSGAVLSGASVAVPLEDKLLVGSLSDSKILICDRPRTAQ